MNVSKRFKKNAFFEFIKQAIFLFCLHKSMIILRITMERCSIGGMKRH